MEAKGTTFFELLKNELDLDRRDNRGKKHCVSLVVIGLIIGLFCCRDGNLSSIHRCLTNRHKAICNALGIEFKPAVSRAQLPIILKKWMLRFFQNYIFRSLASS